METHSLLLLAAKNRSSNEFHILKHDFSALWPRICSHRFRQRRIGILGMTHMDGGKRLQSALDLHWWLCSLTSGGPTSGVPYLLGFMYCGPKFPEDGTAQDPSLPMFVEDKKQSSAIIGLSF